MYHKNGETYPNETQLNKENVDEKKAKFLNLEEEINNNIIHVQTYDKREIFQFEIINHPDLSSNIPIYIYTLRNLLITNHLLCKKLQ